MHPLEPTVPVSIFFGRIDSGEEGVERSPPNCAVGLYEKKMPGRPSALQAPTRALFLTILGRNDLPLARPLLMRAPYSVYSNNFAATFALPPAGRFEIAGSLGELSPSLFIAGGGITL